jgi:hypothetical protein
MRKIEEFWFFSLNFPRKNRGESLRTVMFAATLLAFGRGYARGSATGFS